jgi:hypothetical protein
MQQMRGVVIWYCRAEFRAVIWCEDSKGLGIACGATAWRNPMNRVQVGDFVAFEAEPAGRDRKCRDIYTIEANAAPALPGTLQDLGTHALPVSQNRLLHLTASRD